MDHPLVGHPSRPGHFPEGHLHHQPVSYFLLLLTFSDSFRSLFVNYVQGQVARRRHHSSVPVEERRRGELLLVGRPVAFQTAPREFAALHGHRDGGVELHDRQQRPSRRLCRQFPAGTEERETGTNRVSPSFRFLLGKEKS